MYLYINCTNVFIYTYYHIFYLLLSKYIEKIACKTN